MSAVSIVAGSSSTTSLRMPIDEHGVAVPVRRVQVDLGAHAHQVPAHALTGLRIVSPGRLP